jgi:hypothetical protein
MVQETFPEEARQDPLEVSSDDDFLYYLKKGADLLHRGHSAEARTALERACELKSDSAKARNLLGLAYFKLGLLEPARGIYASLVQEHPHEPALHVNLGLVLLREGRLEEAETSLRTALMLSPDHARAHCYLGLTLYRRGELLLARDHFLRGGQAEFARRLEEKLAVGRAAGRAGMETLRAIADAGMGEVERGAFSAASMDERGRRDEGAWETQVGHKNAPRAEDLELPSLIGMSSSQPVERSGARSSLAPNRTSFAPNRSSLTPNRSSLQPMSPSMAPTPAPTSRVPQPQRNASQTGKPSFPPYAASVFPKQSRPPEISSSFDRFSIGPTLDLMRRPSLIPSGRPDVARYADLPPIPFIEPSLRLFDDLSWAPGFTTGRDLGPQARLVMKGTAFLRRSSIMTAVGDVSYSPAVRVDDSRGSKMPLGGSADPIYRLDGDAKLLLRVWHYAAALRDARTMVVVESALVGFEGEIEWEPRRIRELDAVLLEGKGSVLLDCPGAPVVVTLSGNDKMVVNPEAVLAWTDGVLAEQGSQVGSPGGHLLQLRGHGLVIIAAPERDVPPHGLVSRL